MYRVVIFLLIIALLINATLEVAQDPSDDARIGFRPDLWGPSQWLMLHIMALNVPRNFGAAVRNFERHLYSLATVLPCAECRNELALVLKELPPRDFLKHGRVGAVAYVYVLRCCVSDRTKGVTCKVAFLEMEEAYLKEFVKPGGVDIDNVMRELRQDADDRGVKWQVESAKIKLRAMLDARAKAGMSADHF